jgi:TolB-like protein/DNA-binding winged helix-turn-helix (wHTH) protein/Flp pilus assembly protein TadD
LEPARIQDLLRFGEDFELDCGGGQLRRSGRRLKVERIPMEILLFLVQQRGELVSREQIVEKVWGKDVYLDTDNSINGAIRKIRQVLKDDPEQPHFIQTISGKGYRFIAPVVGPDAGPDAASEIGPDAGLEEAAPQSPIRGDATWFPQPRPRVIATSIVAAMIVAIVSLGVYLRWFQVKARPSNSGGRIMLAVLPFENLTGDASQQYFSDGMTEEMITQLGSLNPDTMGVIARASVMHYKNSQEELQQIARELGVQYVLEGSVRRDADKVRITAQLIQMKDQTHLWARQYDREPKDVLVVQSEIAREISGEIQAALGERRPITPFPPQTLSPQGLDAYNLYLKGQYFWNKRTPEGFREAIDYYQQAIGKDPGYARAYAGLADSYALMGGSTGAAEFASQARAAALRALQLDDSLPEAHAALALIVQNHDYDWQMAEKEFKRAIELNPNYATGHQWYAEHLAWLGRFDEALSESEQARQLDPLSLIITADNGAILYYSRQYDRAIAQFAAVREVEPYFGRAALIYYAYAQKGMFAEAQAVIDQYVENEDKLEKQDRSGNPWKYANLAYIYGRSGQQAKADQQLSKLLDLNRLQPVDPIVIVTAYLGTGNNDQAIAWLEKAYAEHSNSLTGLKVEPLYDPLRGDPQFQKILRRVGLA